MKIISLFLLATLVGCKQEHAPNFDPKDPSGEWIKYKIHECKLDTLAPRGVFTALDPNCQIIAQVLAYNFVQEHEVLKGAK